MKESNPMPVNLPTDFEAVYPYRDPDGNEYARGSPSLPRRDAER